MDDKLKELRDQVTPDEAYYRERVHQLIEEKLLLTERIKGLEKLFQDMRHQWESLKIAANTRQSVFARNRGSIPNWQITTLTAKCSVDLRAMQVIKEKDIKKILHSRLVEHLISEIEKHSPIPVEINPELGIALAEINLATPNVSTWPVAELLH